MRRLLPFLVVLWASPLWAGTITITAAGFSTLPAQAPANWPAGVTWPGAVAPNGSKAYTVSDADMLRILQWAEYAAIANGQVVPNNNCSGSPPVCTATTQTVGQVLVNFVEHWAIGIRAAVAQYFTAAPTPATPPVLQ